jgi:GH15 family glucan-1,4-alpha-glucosidase
VVQAVPTGRRDTSAGLRSSVRSLLAYQSQNGAFVASPDFSQYSFCWLRDASFIAYALDRAGEHASAGRFHGWVDATIGLGGIGDQIDAAIAKRAANVTLAPEEMPPARFSLDGEVVADDWPNFQIDGYGTWLWALQQHLAMSADRRLPGRLKDTVGRTARYLSAFAFHPCFDVWEESGDQVHTSTLGSVYAGLVAAADLLDDDQLRRRAEEVRSHVHAVAKTEGRYRKSNTESGVDASLLWLGAPFGLVELKDPFFAATAGDIETALMMGGGLRRYTTDTYFGGGAWPVLTCSLGWYYARVGRAQEAQRCLDWVASKRDAQGRLGEQFGGETLDRARYLEWVDRWGLPARDLLWSHAMYVILSAEIEGGSDS